MLAPFGFLGSDAQAQAHYNRVIADGGVIPSGFNGVNSFFNTVKAVYGTNDINTAISAAYDPHYLGYKMGAGSGTTLGQAAQKLYSVKSTENLFLQSEDFANAYWFQNLGTITQNNTIAPNGTLTADLFTKTSSINTLSRVGRNSPFTTTGVHTLSVFVKPSVGNLIQLRLDVDGNTANSVFNFTTKTFTNSGANIISSSFQELPNGWFRLILSGNVLLTTWSVDVCNLFSNPTNDAMWLWGAQLNTGSVALPYTPTTTTASLLADVIQTTAASQPLLLEHTGQNYFYSPRVAGNYVSSPYNASIALRGDLDIKAEIQTNLSSSQQDIFSNNTTGNLKLTFRLNGSNGLRLLLYLDGVNVLIYDSSVNIATITNRQWVRVTRNATTGIIQFFTSTDGTTWTQLGSNLSGATGNLFNGLNAYEVGSSLLGTSTNGFQGAIYRVLVSQTINGAAALDFNPAEYNPSISQVQWTSSTSEIWSINTGTATTGYKAALVTKTIVQGDGVDDVMSSSVLTSLTSWTNYVSYIGYTGGGAGRLLDTISNFQHNEILLSASTIPIFNGGLTIPSRIINLLSFLVAQKTTSNSSLGYQNVNSPTVNLSDARAYTFTGVRLFAAQNGAGNGNALLSTLTIASQADNSTNRTAMYNAIRGFNNNAF